MDPSSLLILNIYVFDEYPRDLQLRESMIAAGRENKKVGEAKRVFIPLLESMMRDRCSAGRLLFIYPPLRILQQNNLLTSDQCSQ